MEIDGEGIDLLALAFLHTAQVRSTPPIVSLSAGRHPHATGRTVVSEQPGRSSAPLLLAPRCSIQRSGSTARHLIRWRCTRPRRQGTRLVAERLIRMAKPQDRWRRARFSGIALDLVAVSSSQSHTPPPTRLLLISSILDPFITDLPPTLCLPPTCRAFLRILTPVLLC